MAGYTSVKAARLFCSGLLPWAFTLLCVHFVAPSTRARAPQAGLKAASIESVDALKNQYPPLRPFLEEVQKNHVLRSQFKQSDLRAVWETTSKSSYSHLEHFVAQLELAGLMEKRGGEKFDYGFASLYIDAKQLGPAFQSVTNRIRGAHSLPPRERIRSDLDEWINSIDLCGSSGPPPGVRLTNAPKIVGLWPKSLSFKPSPTP